MPLYHVWFATKRRKWLIQGEVVDFVREQMRAIAAEKGLRLLECEAIVDHVHLILETAGRPDLSKAMNYLKGTSSRRLGQQFPDFKQDAGIGSFWQHRYTCKEISPAAVPAVSRYIRTQWERLSSYER
ncbi:MAG: IS200/IS605 family transposase [Dehalococcoidia bacterium]|nr:IS200/IS605 family transposase [Dehalococcoidia bacterium]